MTRVRTAAKTTGVISTTSSTQRTLAAYFASRQRLLYLYAAKPDELGELLGGGLVYEQIFIEAEAGGADVATQDRRRKAFISTESEILLHHAAEALIRLFIGHAEHRECPWLGCASMRSFPEFNAAVSDIAAGRYPHFAEQVRYVFLPFEDVTPPDRAAALTGIQRLLRMLARRLEEDRNLYNAGKHGMAVIPRDADFAVGTDLDNLRSMGSGPSFAFLEWVKKDKQIVYSLRTSWVDIQTTMLLTELTIEQMQTLWRIAQARYVGAPIDGDLQGVSVEGLDALGSGRSTTGGIRSFSRAVATETLD
jgi:hypothetical protein